MGLRPMVSSLSVSVYNHSARDTALVVKNSANPEVTMRCQCTPDRFHFQTFLWETIYSIVTYTTFSYRKLIPLSESQQGSMDEDGCFGGSLPQIQGIEGEKGY